MAQHLTFSLTKTGVGVEKVRPRTEFVRVGCV